MGFFDRLKHKDIMGSKGVRVSLRCGTTGCRTQRNMRRDIFPKVKMCITIDRVPSVVAGKQTPLYVYCYSGSRSGQAVAVLKHMGYQM